MSPSAIQKTHISSFIDTIWRVKSRPAKKSKQIAIVAYLATKIPWDRVFSETQINDLLKMRHTFGDPALLRRELFIQEYVNREIDGSKYRRN